MNQIISAISDALVLLMAFFLLGIVALMASVTWLIAWQFVQAVGG